MNNNYPIGEIVNIPELLERVWVGNPHRQGLSPILVQKYLCLPPDQLRNWTGMTK